MYELKDTIIAVSSPASNQRAIVRISGPLTISVLRQIFEPPVEGDKTGLIRGTIAVGDGLKINTLLYLFVSPHSYTGETVAEIHIHTNPAVTETLLGDLLLKGLRAAGPGEFTARAYLNGKIDLSQAEAVGEIVASSNRFQLAAAEKLLSGRLAETAGKLRDNIMDCLSLIEAGLDFSGEDIEFISDIEAAQRLAEIKEELERLLSGSISCESVIDLPAVGIAGVPGAGKSSLLNKLLGRERSIVSGQRKTTRDVLTGLLMLTHCRCVLFDCAGLILETGNILDKLAHDAAVEAIRNASVVLYCVDISKADWTEDVLARRIIEPKILIPVATKSDLLPEEMLADRIAELNKLFDIGFLPISAQTGIGLEQLRGTIDEKLIKIALGGCERGTRDEARETSLIALTARHKQAVTEAIGDIAEAIDELKTANDEVAAVMLRAALQSISGIEQQHVDEQILKRIFSRFCIGK